MTLDRHRNRADQYQCRGCQQWHPIDAYLVKLTTVDDTLVRSLCLDCRTAAIGAPQTSHGATWTEPTLFDIGVLPAAVAPKPADTNDAVIEIFDYWMTAHGRHTNTTLTRARRNKILGALRRFDVATIKAAIDGVLQSDWHMGRNPLGRHYTDLTIVLRDEAQIDKFAALATTARTALDADELF